ncbi:MAG: substrate-binding domain-containing protein [Lachnospiraceae bacterium]|jgi:phosphate transport system substrate-binding protein|nr:substrate-binding domain-containing protein [Lachnospiraceae bacterium]
MSSKKYFIITALIALILSPIAATIGLVGAALILPPILVPALVWVIYARWAPLHDKASEIFLPIFAVFCYYAGVWIIIFGLAGYRYDSNLFGWTFLLLALPYLVINFLMAIGGDLSLFPAINLAVFVITVLSIIITRAVCKKKIIYDKRIIIYGMIFLCLLGFAGFQFYDRSTKFLERDYQAERVEDEVNLYYYRPFGDDNLLRRLNEPPTITITDNYPKLDGATAAYPVYAAMVQELYKGLDERTVGQYVACSTTDEAYERLINGEIDIFFGAQPSQQQVEMAQARGVELALTPIAKEAFVFIVNRDNPVDSLTLEQIQDIYQKKITNWKNVGGKNEKIIPFQRPENSGSQTIMLAMVMRDKPLPAPLLEELAGGMGAAMSRVAVYRNYSSAIGYSFRYFATDMKPNENIKLLAINGIEPTIETIRTGTYPFTVEVYAVTAGSTNENTEKLLKWVLSEQGQNFIEICGYVRK